MTEAALNSALREADQRLDTAYCYEHVVLWFEHDSYDQLVLARCLARLADGLLPVHLEQICIDHHPDVPRFNGLGQLEPVALAGLWRGRRAVTAAQIALGQSIWMALRQADPTALQAVAATATPALPVAAPALWRHLQELPGMADGLSLTQRLVLTILSESPMRIGRIFAAMVDGVEPSVFMGNIGVLGTIAAMAGTDPPVLTIEPGDKPFPRMATVTETGRQVLAGRSDYLSLHPADRWAGGVQADRQWRWDDAAGQIASGALVRLWPFGSAHAALQSA